VSETPALVAVDALTNEQLRKLLDGWNPDVRGQDPRTFLLTAVRNRFGNFIAPERLAA
jgi:hypothetical protein